MGTPSETQDERRKEIVGGTVSAAEKALIDQARELAGYKRMSHFVRDVMLERARLIVDPPARRRPDQKPRSELGQDAAA